MGKNGLCKDLVAERVSKEKCCELGGSSVATSWSPNDLDAGALFFWRVLGDGVPCARCKGTFRPSAAAPTEPNLTRPAEG